MYRADVYFLSKQIAEIPIYLFIPSCFLIAFYLMVGLVLDASHIFYALAVVLAMTQVIVGFGYFVSVISSNEEVASAVGPPLIVPMLLLGGFFMNTA